MTRAWGPRDAAGDVFRGSIAATYLADRIGNPLWDSEHESVRKYLSWVEDGTSVLDVPFGTGRFVPLYIEKHMVISGIDISAEMLAVAHATLGDVYHAMEIRIGLAENLPYLDQHFDVAVCVRFLESIVPYDLVASCLAELRRVTRRYAIVRLTNRISGLPPTEAPSANEKMGSRFFLHEVAAFVQKTGWKIEASEIAGLDHDGCGEKRVCLLKAI